MRPALILLLSIPSLAQTPAATAPRSFLIAAVRNNPFIERSVPN